MKNHLLIILILFTSIIAHAEPIVIVDYGGHNSAIPNVKEAIQKSKETLNHNPAKPARFDDSARYPIRSRISSGYLKQPIKLIQPLKGAKPFFVIGSDSLSRSWLEKNKEYLVKIGAQGLATNISNKNTFMQLTALASPLPLVAVPIDDIANALHFSTYPVLVTSEEIAQ